MHNNRNFSGLGSAVLFFAVLFLLLSAPLLTGCGADDTNNGNTGAGDGAADITIDVSALADKLLAGVPFQDEMSEVEPDVFYMLYDLSEEDVDDSILITSTGATAEEIAVIRAAAEDKVQTVQDAVNARVQAQRDGFEDYVPEELEKLEKPVISIAGSYVILCVSDDNDKARDIIQQFIAEN